MLICRLIGVKHNIHFFKTCGKKIVPKTSYTARQLRNTDGGEGGDEVGDTGRLLLGGEFIIFVISFTSSKCS